MFDLFSVLLAVGLFVFALCVVGAILKLVLGLLILPLRLGAWLVSGVFHLVVGLVLLAVFLPLMVALLPVAGVLIVVLAIPVLFVGSLVAACT